MDKPKIAAYYDAVAPERDAWIGKARYYHEDLHTLLRFLIPPGKRVIDVGCGTGDLLQAVAPSAGVGLDISPAMISRARQKFPHLTFEVDNLEDLHTRGKYDYVVLSNLIGSLYDVQAALGSVRHLVTSDSRVVITYFNRLWQPALLLAEKLKWKMPQPPQNWLSPADVENLLVLNGFDVVRRGARLLCPIHIPVLSRLINRWLAPLPFFRHLCLTTYLVARLKPIERMDCRVSVIIPTKNEAGNIRAAVERTPAMGTHTELIFVDGHSTDGTVERILETQRAHPERDIQFLTQPGSGKANAVFYAMDRATGDLLMILDSDLTVPPEELPRFYEAYAAGHGEFINGSRLVYPTEDRAMRFLNMVANHAFALIFSWLLGFRIKDTLCGTKVISARHYRDLQANRGYFGDFDPFGDFDLLFGAAKLSLKFVEIPVRYKARTYGDVKIRRFRDGFLLLRMVLFALRKIKFI